MLFFEPWWHKFASYFFGLSEFYLRWIGQESRHFCCKTVLSNTDSRYSCTNHKKNILGENNSTYNNFLNSEKIWENRIRTVAVGGNLLTDLMLSFIKKNFIWRTFFKFGMFYKHLCSIRQNLIDFREISRGKIYIIHIYENAIENVLIN